MTRRLKLLGGAAFRWVIQPVLVIAVIIAGGALSVQMASSSSGPVRNAEDAPEYQPLVETVSTKVRDEPLRIRGFGTIQARRQVLLTPQVGGQVVEAHPRLRPGGEFTEGEVLLNIERRDYELAIQRAESEVALRQKELDIEQAEGRAAQEEWIELNPNEAVPPLVARQPQIDAAIGALRSANAQVDQARLDLRRTSVIAPFDGRVLSASAETGQVVSAGVSIAEIYDTSVFEVPVPIRTDNLAWISLPAVGSNEGGSKATISVDIGGTTDTIVGSVVRLEGEIDSSTRLVNVVVAFRTEAIPPRIRRFVMPGLYVEVELHGPILSAVTRLDRALLRDGGQVWLADNGRLKLAKPELIHASASDLFVRGIANGSSLIISSLEIVSDGMSVRTTDTEERRDLTIDVTGANPSHESGGEANERP